MQGVAYLHDNNPIIIHNDLKPDNILVMDEYAGPEKVPRVVLADYGHMIFMGAEYEQGDPRYMSPELWEAALERARTQRYVEGDVWALGVTLFEMLSKKPRVLPFVYEPCIIDEESEKGERKNVRRFEMMEDKFENALVDPNRREPVQCKPHLDVSEETEEILRKALNRDFTERYSAKQMVNMLR